MKKSANKSKKEATVVLQKKTMNVKNYYYLLGLIVFFVFANTISGGYNLDDELVTMNHRFTSQGLTAVKDIFTNSYYADDMGYAYGYRPIVHLSFAIEHQFFGENPKVSHFFNVLLYILSIVLFFKLLMKWFGLDQIKLAFLAVILFALHPVHTEVVASIKNRDEILAFLFIILTGLSMIKYLDKAKISSLLWTVFLFTIAMLSKKSVYSMAIVLPVAIVLFRNLNRNQLAIISLSVIFPAAIIGSEMDLFRMILMIVLPIIGIGSIYFIKTHFIQKENGFDLKSLILKPIIPISIITIIAIWSIYTGNFEDLIFTIPFMFWLIIINFQMGLIILVMLSLTTGYLIKNIHFSFFSTLLSTGYGFYFFKKAKGEKFTFTIDKIIWISLFILSMLFFLVNSHKNIHFLLLFLLFLFFWLLFKKSLLSVIYVLILTSIVLIYNGNIYFIMIVLVFNLLYINKTKIKIKNWSGYFVVLVFSILVSFFSYENYQESQKQTALPKTELPTNIQKSKINPEEKNFLKEGRELEFVENTLVAPHTIQETIGTGAATLGEYIRLMVFPNELSFYYGFARTNTVSLANPFVWISILIHLGLIFLAIWQIKRRPIISFGIMWYLLSIILFSNWVELVAGMVAERLLFVASAGFCIFIAGIVFWIKPQFSSKKPYLVEGVVGLLIIAFVFKTIDRNALWNNPITLMENDMNHLQASAQANNLYALRLMATSNENPSITEIERKEAQQKALFHFSEAVRIDSTFFNALFDKGRAAQQMGDTAVAIETFKVAIQREPDYIDSYQFLLMEYEKKQDWKNYISTAKKLLSKDKDPNTYDFISKGFFMQNKPDSSLVYIYQGLKNFPNDANLIERKKYLESVVPVK